MRSEEIKKHRPMMSWYMSRVRWTDADRVQFRHDETPGQTFFQPMDLRACIILKRAGGTNRNLLCSFVGPATVGSWVAALSARVDRMAPMAVLDISPDVSARLQCAVHYHLQQECIIRR
jgi:hypothetical protein